jgi:protoporphyrinogen oxidase
MYTILGAGLSGLSAADHLAKKKLPFQIFESKAHGGGHIYSEQVDGFTWDEGPHVSFTKYNYVKEYFAENCNQEFLEYSTNPTNFYKGNWIPHPAQSHMYAVPEPLRSESITAVHQIRNQFPEDYVASNYQDWIDYAFGKVFAENFPKVYTDKYWTTVPANLTTDWIGNRIYFPEIADMISSAHSELTKQTHYISKVRYPKSGGFYSYINKIERKLPVFYNKNLNYISFDKKEITFNDGEIVWYDKLISTIPLPLLIANSDAPDTIKQYATELHCSQVLIFNVVVNHPAPIENHWIYVYDKNFYSTRINFTNLLASNNGVAGKCGIQVEVYFSAYRTKVDSTAHIENAVIKELIQMQLIKSEDDVHSYHSKWIDWANVIFDLPRRNAQNQVLNFLETKGLKREDDDLEPMTDWDAKLNHNEPLGDIILAGRFAQWKYYWTDDCVMRGLYIGNNVTV